MNTILEKARPPAKKMQTLLATDLYEFGGTIESVRNYQQGFIKYFQGCHRVLDLGCGRGVFLKLLAESGIEGVAVDLCGEAVALCQKQGFRDVYHQDVFAYLKDHLSEKSAYGRQDFDGIFCSHLIEHLDFASATELLHLCYQVLKLKGRIAVVTPNPESPKIMGSIFWLDPSHVRPYPLPLLESMLKKSGFKIIDKGSFDSPGQGIRSLCVGIFNSLLNLKKIGTNTFVVGMKQ
ncbi:MAG: class I SAM-dependent methyltransferase [candidate division Zixibacteria bacterium]|jgi:O-antigen chain-terminating methyltransferase|nr:class I SAM-dependent methyltransferase [candidate division Zixibacteria bacterium]